MKHHLSIDSKFPYAFIPVNVGRHGVAAPLAVVDRECAEAVHRLPWRSSSKGTLSRQFSEPGQRDARGLLVRSTEQLAHRVKALPPYSPTYFVNADPLDCRAANVALAKNLPEARTIAASYKPDSVIAKLPGFNEALNELRTNAQYYEACVIRRRSTKLTEAQVTSLLTQVLPGGPLEKESIASIAAWAEAEFGVKLYPSQARALIMGESQPVPGFDYAKLKAARPTRRDRAVERWRNRIK